MPSRPTPNMGLVLPEVGVDSPNLSANLTNEAIRKIDRHNHSPQGGVKISADRVDFTSGMDVNNQSLVNVKEITFRENSDQSGDIPVGALFARGGDLIYKDLRGRETRITLNGLVASSVFQVDSGSPSPLLYGWSAPQTRPTTDQERANAISQSRAKAAAIASFNVTSNRNEVTVNNLFLGGLLSTVAAPAGSSNYWLWVAVRTSDATNLRIADKDYQDQTDRWVPASENDSDATISVGSPAKNEKFKLFVKFEPYLGGSSVELFLRNFFGVGGVNPPES